MRVAVVSDIHGNLHALEAVLAALGWIFGVGHATGRAISLFGTLLAAAGLVFGVRRHGGSLVLGLGLMTAAGVHRRRARAIRLATIGILGAR